MRSRNSRVGVYIISMNSKPSLRVGRGHDSDIRIPDISVSRFHATITFADGEFYLEDNTSKFGTLIEVSPHIKIEKGMQLQVGRTVLKVDVNDS